MSIVALATRSLEQMDIKLYGVSIRPVFFFYIHHPENTSKASVDEPSWLKPQVFRAYK
jgi:hypothetical protein